MSENTTQKGFYHKIIGYRIITDDKGEESLGIYTIKSIKEPKWIIKQLIPLDLLRKMSKLDNVPYHNLESNIRFVYYKK